MTKKNSNHKELVAALGVILADTYVLLVKSHGSHWNVTGPNFASLHAFFETQYTGLLTAADDIAERIRALGAAAPTSMAQMLEMSSVKETTGKMLSSKEMLTDLINAHEVVVADIAAARRLTALEDDLVTDDLLNQRNAEHDKTLWMLRAHLA